MIVGHVYTRGDIGVEIVCPGAQRKAEDIGKVGIRTEVYAEIVDHRVEEKIDHVFRFVVARRLTHEHLVDIDRQNAAAAFAQSSSAVVPLSAVSAAVRDHKEFAHSKTCSPSAPRVFGKE